MVTVACNRYICTHINIPLKISLIDLESWIGCTSGGRICQGCPLTELQNELSPVFSALLNVVRNKNIRIRILVGGRQSPPTCANSATPLDWMVHNKVEIRHAANAHSAHILLIDGASQILLTSMRTDPASFLYNRESSIILRANKCRKIKTFFIGEFEKAWHSGNPHNVPVPYSNQDVNLMTEHITYTQFPEQPDSALHMLNASITEVTTHRDVEVSEVLYGPLNFSINFMPLLRDIKDSLLLSIPAIADSEICEVLFKLYRKVKILISYTHTSHAEADLTNVRLLGL